MKSARETAARSLAHLGIIAAFAVIAVVVFLR
jgi:hypothetical protein